MRGEDEKSKETPDILRKEDETEKRGREDTNETLIQTHLIRSEREKDTENDTTVEVFREK